MHELVIRGGTVFDGTGGTAFEGDVAIDNGCLTQVGGRCGRGRQEIDAKGRIVAPGWVDIHSHYDGQVTWDPYLIPSGCHGVTTVVMGNCGIGFAPVRPDRHDWLINVMEGVEDIPGTALHAGMRWGWETFPEYLDVLDRMPRALDVAAQISHSAVRDYVMGDRGAGKAPASDDDIARMAALVEEGLRAGAVGFSTSRTKLHLAADGSAVAGSFADERELLGIAQAIRRSGRGVLQLVSDFSDVCTEFAWLRRVTLDTGIPAHFVLVQYPDAPNRWRELLALTSDAATAGAHVHPLVACRPVGMLINLESRNHPFSAHPAYMEIAALPLPERLRAMRTPQVRALILAQTSTSTDRFWRPRMENFRNMFRLGNPPDYEPAPEHSIAAVAAREQRAPAEIAYDILIAGNDDNWLYFPLFNYVDGSFEPMLEMLNHPSALLSLADGGAHCGIICDASAPTFLLTHWARDRSRGPRLPLAAAICMQTSRTADAYGLRDRGRLAPGLRADLNVIDFDRLRLLPPTWAHDLPANGQRLMQRAEGYDATIVAGHVTWSMGEATGEMPGKLIRH